MNTTLNSVLKGTSSCIKIRWYSHPWFMPDTSYLINWLIAHFPDDCCEGNIWFCSLAACSAASPQSTQHSNNRARFPCCSAPMMVFTFECKEVGCACMFLFANDCLRFCIQLNRLDVYREWNNVLSGRKNGAGFLGRQYQFASFYNCYTSLFTQIQTNLKSNAVH